MSPLAPAILFLMPLAAIAGGLGSLNQVDLVELEATTNRAVLVVLLEDDRINTRPAYRTLFKKVNNYMEFVQSGQLREVAPNASASLPPKIVIYGPREASTAEMQNLNGLKLAGQKAGIEVEVLPFRPGLRERPVPIRPPAPKSGA